jgi:hypothetical protein
MHERCFFRSFGAANTVAQTIPKGSGNAASRARASSAQPTMTGMSLCPSSAIDVGSTAVKNAGGLPFRADREALLPEALAIGRGSTCFSRHQSSSWPTR